VQVPSGCPGASLSALAKGQPEGLAEGLRQVFAPSVQGGEVGCCYTDPLGCQEEKEAARTAKARRIRMSLRAIALVSGLVGLGLIAPLAADTLLVANKSDHTVDLIDLDTGSSRATLPTGQAPHEIAVSPDGRTAVVANYGDRAQPGSTLTVLDVGEARVLRTIDLGRHTRPHGVIWISDESLAVTTEGSAHLLVVDPHEGVILTETPTEQEISHMVTSVPRASRAFVANIRSGTVTAVDLGTGKKLADIATGDGAEGIAATPDGSEVWVGNRAADTLSIIDPETLEIEMTVPCPGSALPSPPTADGLWSRQLELER
jgi:YVTN family beta-propeller protein